MKLIVKTFDELTVTELYEMIKARIQIFTMEQQIMYQDLDDVDYTSLHCFLMEDKKVVAYLRAYDRTPGDHSVIKIGRVLSIRHGEGLGAKLMRESMPKIKERLHCKTICMDAQKHALGFYEKLGFVQISGDFLEEGIVHVAMQKDV